MNFCKVLAHPQKKKGFIIFVVVGIAGIIGMTFMTLHWLSSQRNLKAHKTYFNETSKNLARSGLEILVNALHLGLQVPPHDILNSVLSGNSTPAASFYGYFLQDLPLFHSEPDKEKIMPHAQIMELMDPALKEALKVYLSEYKGAELEFSIAINPIPLTPDTPFQDTVEKRLNLHLFCTAKWNHSVKTISLRKKALVYNLLPPILTKFTFYHKSPAGKYYNRLVTKIDGVPSNGLHPMILINGPKDSAEIPGDEALLQSSGGFTHLSSQNSLSASKSAILKRGFLFFGHGGDRNVLNLTPGSFAAGQYFHLFNPTTPGGAQNWSVTQIHGLPSFCEDAIELTSFYDPLFASPRTETGKSEIYSVYEGFFEINPAATPPELSPSTYIQNNYSIYSSLIHPFGKFDYPSRAYTVGAAYQAVAKVSNLTLDQNASSSDEQEIENCPGFSSTYGSGVQADSRDASLSILAETDPGLWDSDQPLMYDIHPSGHYGHRFGHLSPPCEIPKSMKLPAPVSLRSVFGEFQNYDKHMSKVIDIHLNHLLTYTHFSHSFLPPEGADNFTGHMFPSLDPNTLEEIEYTETWPFSPSAIHSSDATYLNGPVSDFNPDAWLSERIFLWFSSQEELEKSGYLVKNANQWFLNTRGHMISLHSDLVLDASLQVTEDSHLYVQGNCHVPPVEITAFFALSCNSITLLSQNLSTQEQVYNGFFNAREKIFRADPMKPMILRGGIAMRGLDMTSFFRAPATIEYNPQYSPLEPVIDFYYRMVMDDHDFGLEIQP